MSRRDPPIVCEQAAAGMLIAARQGLTLRGCAPGEPAPSPAIASFALDPEPRIAFGDEDRALDADRLVGVIRERAWSLYET